MDEIGLKNIFGTYRLPPEIQDLINQASLAPGGEVFRDYFEDGVKEPPNECEKFLKEELDLVIKDYKEVLGEPEKARRIESAKLKGIFEGWKEYFRENPTHGEYAGKICGCFVRLGKLKEMKELLKFIQETNEGKFEWDV